MKVLYTDLICPFGHIFYNNIQISYITKKHKVDFMFQKGYAEKLDIPDGCKILEIEPFHGGTNVFFDAIKYRVYMWKYQRRVADVAKQGAYDLIFISSFETLSFCLTLPYKSPVVAICHNNIDYIQTNRVKRHFFKLAADKVNFVALNRTTSDYFNEIGIKHILASHGTIVQNEKSEVENYVFMPANDCIDIEILKYLQSEFFLDFLHKKGLKLYIKGKFISVRHPSFVHLPNYISQEDFDKYMSKALVVLLPYDINKYRYRSSGLFFEAVGKNKAIIAPDYPNFEIDVCPDESGIFLYDKQDDIPEMINKVIRLGNNISYERLFVKMESDMEKLIHTVSNA